MQPSSAIRKLLSENKTPLILIAIGLFLIELEIFALAAMKSGKTSHLQILDENGRVLHETSGSDLSRFNKYYFEKTFGPLEAYEVNLITEERPFPFRAWFAASVGVPVGAILLFGFAARAYLAIFHGPLPEDMAGPPPETPAASKLEKVLHGIGRLNIFIIGCLIFLAAFAFWTVPNLLVYLGKTGTETLVRFKWVFIPAAIILTVLVVWVIYLRYLLAKKAIESQATLARYRLELEMGHAANPAIEARPAAAQLELRPPETDSHGGVPNDGHAPEPSDPA